MSSQQPLNVINAFLKVMESHDIDQAVQFVATARSLNSAYFDMGVLSPKWKQRVRRDLR